MCSIILLIEKFIIQIIAYNFHKTSYADRIADNKFAVRALATLYLNSRDIGRRDTLDGRWRDKEKMNATKVLKKGLKSAKKVVQGTSTALGTVASEIIGERVLQSNSPQSMVTSALASPNKSRQLARRIFFSFTPSDRQVMLVEDIAPFFPNQDKLHQVCDLPGPRRPNSAGFVFSARELTLIWCFFNRSSPSLIATIMVTSAWKRSRWHASRYTASV